MLLLLGISFCLLASPELPVLKKGAGKLRYTVSDDEPKAFIRLAMRAAGNYQAVKTIKFETIRANHNKWQNYSFQHPKPTFDNAYREIDFEKKKIYFKTVSRYGGGYVFEFVTAGSDTVIYNYDVNKSRNGKRLVKGNQKTLENTILTQSAFLPYYNLKALLETTDSLSLRKEGKVTVIRKFARNGNRQDFYFSPAYQLTRTSLLQPGLVVDTWYSDYVSYQGIYYPKKTRVTSNGETQLKDEVVALSINKPFNDTILAIPAEYVLPVQASANMKASEIKKDIYLIENVQGRNVLFVNLANGILVTEAPLSSEVSRSIIALIHNTLPGKPIKYVHLSHFHNDHTHGIRAFVHEGTTIITTPATAKAIAEVINDTSGRYIDDLSKEPRPAKFELFNQHKILSDAQHPVRFYTVPSNHAEGLSFLYLPVEKLIYEGDLYTLPDDGTITPATETTRGFHRFLQMEKIVWERMVGHHGLNTITPAMLETAVQMTPAASK
jgi:glyoxylase-like metal-dependent hydrolase (beta-lactamase superfamily II)